MMKKLLLLIIFILTINSVTSIGLSSTQLKENPILFEPGYKLSIQYTISKYNYDAEPYLAGDLQEYAVIENLQDFETYKTFSVTLTLPDKIEPAGLYTLYVGAGEVAPPNAGIVGLTRAQKSIGIMVLYDEPMIKFNELVVPDMNIDEEAELRFLATSLTKQDVNNIWAEIKIYNYDNELVKTFKIDEFNLESAESKTIQQTINSEGLIDGQYRAKVDIYWADETTTLNKNFNIGTLNIDLLNISRNFTAGQINKIRIDTKSDWNGEIDGVFAQLFVDEEEQTATQDYTFKPFQKVEMLGYLDLSYVEEGEHQLEVILNYEEEKTTHKETITVKGKAKEKPSEPIVISFKSTEIMMILIIIVLILIIAIIFLQRRKK